MAVASALLHHDNSGSRNAKATQMVQDFAKIRAAAAAEKAPVAAPADLTLLFTGLITGLGLGVFISFLVYLSGVLPPAGQQSLDEMNASSLEQQQEQALAQQQLNEDLERAAARLQLEFYQELPNYEVIVNTIPTDSPVPRRRQIPAATADNSDIAERAGTARTIDSNRTESDRTADAIAQTIAELTGASSAQSSRTSAAPASGNLGSGISYMVQAGAFQQEAAAMIQSNRLVGLGLNARVKKEALSERTLFLVQAGPYQTREQLNQAESILRSNNIDSMRITLGGL